MNIAVLLKQTFDTEAKIEIAGGAINKKGVGLIINPYDEYAVEEALKLKEKNGGEVTIISAGADTPDAMRQALAMGADKAISVEDPALAGGDEYTTAVVLAKAVSTIPYDLVLAGWREGSAQVAVRVAEELGLPHINVVTKLDIDGGKATATRDIEGGNEIVEVPVPAVITAQKGLNEPRYPSMKGIMQAKKKPIQKLSLGDLGLSADQVAAKVKVQSYFLPSAKAAGKIIGGEAPQAAAELARLLREEANAI
ncbi:electron transfer flavoprotein subunit beta/FixA family protein [Pelotomaculum terephthalicicum JT]|uniref:electron transfer flavoprotein subunit beta/FixA family protein n=1 Tax=Pelotomaculum TaxID=191373 RepID=UPI0009C42D19|nr:MULTISPECIES: electron transfer flavoprotein subunit beta/FixA family protein [Pelotomaculum]MCG9966512.1 electron transfer flavoprotein subunit beta/FixA family protein [Pelotomaculum terephthalicicum JT]OPX86010.1 MAG: Electron transfer flavoprotein subunit beta [Pelotomaculum sp. PtaB.Bin117]